MKKQSYIIIASAVLVVTLATTQFASAAGNGFTRAVASITGEGNASAPISGTVTAINGSTITITNKKGTLYTIDASSAKMRSAGEATPSLSTLKIGDTIAVMGTVTGNSVAAKTILEGVDFAKHGNKQMFNEKRIPGKITAINGSTITIEVGGKTKNATAQDFTVTTTSSTIFKKNGQAGTLSDLAVGQFISVAGTIDTNAKTITATEINSILPGTHAQLTGAVLSISGNTFVLQTKDGTSHTIDATSAKVVTGFNRNDQGTIAKLAVGDKVAVTGAPSSDNTTTIATIIRDTKK